MKFNLTISFCGILLKGQEKGISGKIQCEQKKQDSMGIILKLSPLWVQHLACRETERVNGEWTLKRQRGTQNSIPGNPLPIFL